jgi:hypothetical protein
MYYTYTDKKVRYIHERVILVSTFVCVAYVRVRGEQVREGGKAREGKSGNESEGQIEGERAGGAQREGYIHNTQH